MNVDPPSPFSDSEHPPFLKSWSRLYGLVLVELAILIVLFYAFMKAFE